jgi:hypothetical protein
MNDPPHAWTRAGHDCIQDHCENVPFASIGGTDHRDDPVKPKWIRDEDWEDYLRGYVAQAEAIYGTDWKTCQFSWKLALVIVSPHHGGYDGPLGG